MPLLKVNAHHYALLLKAMIPGDLTLKELAEETGLHYTTVREYTREMWKAKVIHITRWEEDSRGRPVLRCYKLGPGHNARRPVKSCVQRQREYRSKKKSMELNQRMAGYTSVGIA